MLILRKPLTNIWGGFFNFDFFHWLRPQPCSLMNGMVVHSRRRYPPKNYLLFATTAELHEQSLDIPSASLRPRAVEFRCLKKRWQGQLRGKAFRLLHILCTTPFQQKMIEQ